MQESIVHFQTLILLIVVAIGAYEIIGNSEIRQIEDFNFREDFITEEIQEPKDEEKMHI